MCPRTAHQKAANYCHIRSELLCGKCTAKGLVECATFVEDKWDKQINLHIHNDKCNVNFQLQVYKSNFRV